MKNYINMKRIVLALSFLLSTSYGFGQTDFQEISADANKAGGNYLPYPTPTKKLTEAPNGYEPFYISHYGRHGARYMSDSKNIDLVFNTFLKEKENGLTELGESTFLKIKEIKKQMYLKEGELTPLGYEQMNQIANRMFENFPEVFKNHKHIDARATHVPRSIISMSTFCLALKERNKYLDIQTHVSNEDMRFLCMDRVKSPDRPEEENEWYNKYSDFCEKNKGDRNRLITSLFAKKDFKKESANAFCDALFNVARAVQDMPLSNISLWDLFTPEERWHYWQAQNAFWYYFCGAYRTPSIRAKEFGEELIKNIIKEADKAIEGNNTCLSIRFGHDTGMMPLLVLANINNTLNDTISWESLHTKWSDFKVIPMAANVQFVFYRNNANDVLVKVLVNEEEARLPISTKQWPYYKWDEVRKYFELLLSAKN